MTEDQLLRAVIQLARSAGYLCYHARPARTARGRWVTAMSGDKGFPDLLMVGNGRLIVAELKSDKGTLSDEQARWRLEMHQAGVECHMWRPIAWEDGTIAKVLGCEGNVIRKRITDKIPF